jgi:hypothetical protein
MSKYWQRTEPTTATSDGDTTDHAEGCVCEVPKAASRSQRDVETTGANRERETSNLGRDFASAFDEPEDNDLSDWRIGHDIQFTA